MKNRSIFVVFILLTTVLLISGCRGANGAFGPIFPTPTQIGLVSRPPVPVNFDTLNSDPFVFVDRFVRVSGRFQSIDRVVCNRQRGPSIDWYLESDGFQMNMSGFGSVVDIAPDQAFFTLDGIWRQYDGPVGCTKEPKEETIWYLEVVRIVDPNPIVASIDRSDAESQILIETPTNFERTTTPTVSVGTQPGVSPTSTPTNTSAVGLPPTATLTPSGQGTRPSSPSTTATATLAGNAASTPTITATVANTPTQTPTLAASLTITPTQTPTPDPDGGNGGGLGNTGSGTPNPATPVPTPSGGYPNPNPNPAYP